MGLGKFVKAVSTTVADLKVSTGANSFIAGTVGYFGCQLGAMEVAFYSW
jgi:hypothetical protein